MNRLSRARGVAAPITVVLASVALLGAFAAGGAWDAKRNHQDAFTALLSDLDDVHARVAAARDSTDQQIIRARHLLNWLEQAADASSAGLVATLSALRQRADAPSSLITTAELATSGELDEVVRDRAVRTRLLALDRRLLLAAAEGDPVFENYRMQLEQSLSPGMWRYVFQMETGQHPIDYRAALQELYSKGFDRTIRSMLRTLQTQRAELDGIEMESRKLLEALRPVVDARGQS